MQCYYRHLAFLEKTYFSKYVLSMSSLTGNFMLNMPPGQALVTKIQMSRVEQKKVQDFEVKSC